MPEEKMRAWVLTRPGELKLKEVTIPEISENQVLVEIERACICNGSDPGIYHGHEAYQTPMVFGHEASGRIIRKGKNIRQFQVGDRVCWWFEAGAFAEYQAVTVENVAMFRVPENLSLDEGPVLELALASCRAIMELPAASGRKTMAICGLGPSGLVLLQYAKALGYERVIGWDLYRQRRKLALALGADAVFHPGELSAETVKEIEESDVGVVMMGDDQLPGEPTVTLFMRTVRSGGLLVSYGHPEQGCRFSPYVFQARNLRMQGPVNDMEIIRSRGRELMEMVAEGLNSQRIYGVDVISRIKASCEGRREELQACIRKDLRKGIERLTAESGRSREQIAHVAVAGNTAMIHFLMGYPCDTLGVAPFRPYSLALLKGSSAELTGLGHLDATATVFPGISGYVGGDITAGLLYCGFDRAEKVSMLIDLGTNGELAIGNNGKILVTSTAAGPAFEGGNISRGIGSVSGAICGVEIREGRVLVSTIMDQPPVGICGTGVIETVAELLRNEIIDETGAMTETYFETGFTLAADPHGNPIAFTRHDVRELMLAKAAIRAGIEVLMKEFGICAGEVDKVYLSGGFGFGINIDKAVSIGIFPKEFEDKIEIAGNSSLGGIHKYLSDSRALQGLEKILENSREVQLGGNQEFNNRFIEEMCFGCEW